MRSVSNELIEAIANAVDIPEQAHESAEARYRDLGEWFGRPDAACYAHDPQIYPQGSFRLGTVVRGDEYDLDFGCRLRKGISRSSHTQKQLKDLVGRDMESYRQARQIIAPLEPKHRCWRLQYQEESRMSFHMDGVPSIPMEALTRARIAASMASHGIPANLSFQVANLSGFITDDRHPDYRQISENWLISNSEGYALWFESRILQSPETVARIHAKSAEVAPLPARKWKSPLQRAVQLLKRHRDIMFDENPELKPISVIITTLAAEAYAGEQDLGSAMRGILERMESHVRSFSPRVPNPVHPAEDFAERWNTEEGRRLRLEDNFRAWLYQAQRHFDSIANSLDAAFVVRQASAALGVALPAKEIERILGPSSAAPRPQVVHKISQPPKPWAEM